MQVDARVDRGSTCEQSFRIVVVFLAITLSLRLHVERVWRQVELLYSRFKFQLVQKVCVSFFRRERSEPQHPFHVAVVLRRQ